MLLSQILDYIKQKGIPYSVERFTDTDITGISVPAESTPTSLLFFIRGIPNDFNFSYGACLIKKSAISDKASLTNVIQVEDPRLVTILVANLFKPYFSQKKALISARAVIHPEAKIGKNVIVMDNAVLGKCTVGDYTVIHPNVVVYDGVEIGALCEIDANTTLGAEGMGQNRYDDGRILKFPHFSRLIIKDNVLIGPNVTISKGILTPTIIESGCMINALVHIAHNVHIGGRTALSMGAIVGGSAKIGKGCWLAPNSTVRNQVTIADNITVGMGAVVTKSFHQHGMTLVGIPARILENEEA